MCAQQQQQQHHKRQVSTPTAVRSSSVEVSLLAVALLLADAAYDFSLPVSLTAVKLLKCLQACSATSIAYSTTSWCANEPHHL
eukprot:19068-Heterococcus_DN1.PRE.2